MIDLLSITKKKNGRYLLEFNVDDIIVKHTVIEETLLSLSLFGPRKLTKKEYEITIKEAAFDLLYQKSLDFINYQMRSVHEVNKYLGKYTTDNKIIKQIVHKLKENHFLDDNEYINKYISEKIEYDFIGPKKIVENLFKKGLNKENIIDALMVFNDDLEVEKINYLIDKETKYKIKKPYFKFVNSLKQKLITKGYNLRNINISIGIKDDIIKSSIDIETILNKEIIVLRKKYDVNVYDEKDIVIKKLLQKGFSYQNINKYLKGDE